MPGSSGSSTCAYERKSVRERWATYIWFRLQRLRRRGAGDRTGGAGRLHRVPTELLAQRGHRLHGRALLLARREAGEQRRRYHGSRDGQVDRLVHRPPTLAGVLDPVVDLPEARVLLEG